MVKWRLLPFLRFSARGKETDEDDGSATTHSENSLVPPQRFEESMFGCRDELGANACSNLQGLFADDGKTCRWPSAELCLSTCGQCPLVEAARKCTSLEEEMDDRMLDEHMDWFAFFDNITSLEMQEKHEHLRGASILNMETPWVAEFEWLMWRGIGSRTNIQNMFVMST